MTRFRRLPRLVQIGLAAAVLLLTGCSGEAALPVPVTQPARLQEMATATPARVTDTPIPLTDTPSPVPPTDIPPIPTDTALPIPPTDTEVQPTATMAPQPAAARIVIVEVNKREEYVDIRNAGGLAQDLAGWVLVSEKGNQRCTLAGTLGPGATLRIWAMKGDNSQGNYYCGFGQYIWNNDDPDLAILYDAIGAEVARK